MTLQNRFYLLISVILIIKVFFALMLPMTGDEAYFLFWARYPDYGYYDHPPMVAWILSLLLSVSDTELWVRFPAILFSMLIGWGIYRLLCQKDESLNQKIAIYAASIYFLIPVNLFAVLMTTDTPLIWWSFLCGVSYYYAQKHDSFSWYFVCGILLGLAFLSKFFSGLLAIAFFIHTILFVRRGIKPYIGLFIIFISLLPAITLNLIWNYNNCWNNYLFNLFNRTQGSSFSFTDTGKYLLMLVFIMPPSIYYIVKNRGFIKALINERSGEHTYYSLFILPVLLFGVLSFFKSIGLHWLFSFVPFLVLGLAKLLNENQLQKTVKFMVVYSLLHVIVIGFVVVTAPDLFKSNGKLYKSLIIGYYPDEILNEVSNFKSDYIFATDSYALSAQLSYHSKENIIVFGKGSYHARQDDFITDFRKINGKNILILSEVPKLAAFSKFFESYEIHTMSIKGSELYYAVGNKFNYEQYRKLTLTRIRKRYYNIPSYLPHKACYMDDRYAT